MSYPYGQQGGYGAPPAGGGYGAPPGGQPGYGAPPGGQPGAPGQPGYGAPPGGQPGYGAPPGGQPGAPGAVHGSAYMHNSFRPSQQQMQGMVNNSLFNFIIFYVNCQNL